MAPFTAEDLEQFAARGIDPEEAAGQIALLRNPPAPIVLDRPCTTGDGITTIGETLQRELVSEGESAAAAGRITKFVPASGAATRMFGELIAALNGDVRPSETPAGKRFFSALDSFAFSDELRSTAGVSGAPASAAEERALLEAMLLTMAFARRPKGLIPFHRSGATRTAFEEHLLEGTAYARAADGTAKLHFTVSPESRDAFVETLGRLTPRIETERSAKLDVSFSEQHPATDTLAIDAEGNPFRTLGGGLLFRPGGHGALLRNLAETGGDLVVIKNIDNILPDEANGEVVRWKRVLIGLLARLQREVFDALSACERTDRALDAAIRLAVLRFSRRPPHALGSDAEKRRFVYDALDRPLRVVGVVKNEGEPGGAPFWVVGHDGTFSVQIVEFAQVNGTEALQAKIFASSTHFNPVDIACGLRSFRGDAFDLSRFVDPEAVFLSRKSHEGRALTALERPGLWNGGMARWNTVCVEVPAGTFAPVKTVFDLLRPQHQAVVSG
ncbi:MAG: DUF4301 family protein [Thermoanaerobaculia bacterium]